MRTLLVTATVLEVKGFLTACGALADVEINALPAGTLLHGGATYSDLPKSSEIDILVTGVGQADTAFHLARLLASLPKDSEYSLLVQAGIGGSFLTMLPRCSIVHVVSEVYGDRGAEDNGSFLDLEEMGLSDPQAFPYREGRLQPAVCALPAGLENLPKVPGVTVNRTLGEPRSIEWVRERYAPAVVSMEGAPFFYAAQQFGVPCIQFRSISDYVGPRDRASWDIPGAVSALNAVLMQWWKGNGPEIAVRSVENV